MLRLLIICFVALFYSCTNAQNIPYLRNTIKNYLPLDKAMYEKIVEASNHIENTTKNSSFFSNHSPLLFSLYPALQNKIAYISLGNFPTPVERLINLEQKMDVGQFWIKRDDATGFTGCAGGNKVRKLEFLLADALNSNASTVLTFGCVASNHTTTTAFYAHLLGLKCILMLKPQPNSHAVRTNLLRMFFYDADMHWSATIQERVQDSADTIIKSIQEDNSIPYVIPTGGSCPLGILGYVNAVLELQEQIDQGLLPEPDYIFVPTGSKGTAVGLLLGIHVCKLKSKLIAIATENEGKSGAFKGRIKELFEATNTLLVDADPTFPACTFDENKLEVVLTSAGKAYGLFTQEGQEAVTLMKDRENIILDGTYTAKAFAGLLDYVAHNDMSNAIVLYWHTYDSTVDEAALLTDYHRLPYNFHQYFEKNVQPLDFT